MQLYYEESIQTSLLAIQKDKYEIMHQKEKGEKDDISLQTNTAK